MATRRIPLLIVDEVGYVPFEAEPADLFFQLVSDRYERACLIVPKQQPFGRWGGVFGDDAVAATMIDCSDLGQSLVGPRNCRCQRLRCPAEGERPSADEGGWAMTPQERFDVLVTDLVGTANVTPPRAGRGFGSAALRYRRRIFAMLVRDRLVVKLPGSRVDALVAAGAGVHYDANKGTPMKEWLSLNPDSGLDWLALAREALGFAGHRD